MIKKIYVGNLSYSSTEDSIRQAFGRYGTVSSCRLITDHETGRSKGFGFVEMSTDDEADTAIAQLDGAEVDGRALKVNEARPQEKRPRDAGTNGSAGYSRNQSY